MEGNVKSNEQVHRKIQVCLQNLALRKLKRCTTCVKNDSLNSNVTIDAPNRENSNSKSFSLESNLNEFSASKERVDLLQDFRVEDLNIPSQCIGSPTRKIKKYVGQKDNGYLNDTRMDTNMKILPRNGRFSLPILKIESSEDSDIMKISKRKETVKEQSFSIDGILESISTRYEHRCCCICRAHGNSSISCGYKCIMTPSSQRVTFHLPSKEETM
ncbi:hypothetical protein M0804_011108 [Polistes exclamans]|nr:hypothetical protein M0804_011108 [Polistes exclamans]